MGMDRVFTTPTITVDQDKYDQLIRAELKAEQYKAALERRIEENQWLIDTIEATEIKVKENKEEEN